MFDLSYNPDDLIVAPATPWVESAIAVIRTSGPGCVEALSPLFRGPKKLEKASGYTLCYGHLVDPETGEDLDEVMAAVYRAPRSYTGQDGVEFFCHGSLPGVASIIKAIKKSGFRDAGPGEFTLRAFLNKKMDLTRAEAVKEIIGAKSKAAHSMALRRLSGTIESKITEIKNLLVTIYGSIEIQLDYPGDEIEDDVEVPAELLDQAELSLKRLLGTYKTGRLYQDGAVTVLTGKTNSGKSSLLICF